MKMKVNKMPFHLMGTGN